MSLERTRPVCMPDVTKSMVWGPLEVRKGKEAGEAERGTVWDLIL